MPKLTKLFEALPYIGKFQSYMALFSMLVSIPILVISCMFGWIAGSDQTNYETDDWQYCFIQSSKIIVNLDILSPGLEVPIPISDVPMALSYAGVQTVILILVAHAVLYRAFKHPSWISASIAVTLFLNLGILTYYTNGPALPVPTQMNATLLTFMNWAKKSTFEHLEGSKCTTTAFSLLWAYLALQLVQFVNLFLVNVAAMYAEYCRALTPSTSTHKMLQNTFWPLVTTAIAFIAYVIMIAGKMSSALNAQHAIEDYEPPAFGATLPTGFFPFQKGSLDLGTLLFVASFMSVIRGYSRQSRSAFRFATGAAFLYICATWSAIVGAARFYRQNEFYDDSKCHDYFQTDPQRNLFGDPDSDQADTYCETFRLSLGAQCIMFFIMHVQMVLCAMTFAQNEPRPSISDSAYLQHDNENPYNRYSDIEGKVFANGGDTSDLKKPLAQNDFMTESTF